MLLEIDFEGAKYSWTGNAWVDARYIKVPASLASALTRSVTADGRVLPPPQSESRRRGSDLKKALDYEIANDNHLLLSANPSKAWRKYPHDWGAIMQGRISLVGVKSMLIRFEAFGPDTEPRSFQNEPGLNLDGVPVCFAGPEVRMDIPLLDMSGDVFNPALGWSESRHGNAFAVRQFQMEAQRMKLLLVVSPPTKLPERTYWDWYRRFWPGGRPGSNRRH